MEYEKFKTERLEQVTMSKIRMISDRARALQAEGRDVVLFSMGEPNFNTPEPIKEATKKALDANKTHYCSNRGILRLRQEIAKKIIQDTGVKYDPDKEIILTSSGAEAINNALFAFLNAGDDVLLLTPSFVSYKCLIHMCGANPIPVPLRPENGFRIDMAELETKVTPRTKMIVMNNPSNPTGVVFDRESLEKLAEFAIRHNLLIFADEIYNNLIYGNSTFTSIASFPGMRERTIMMNGFSKTYAMTGWRVGYLAFPEWMDSNLIRVHQYSTTTGVTFIQEGLADAMNLPETAELVEEMRKEFDERRKLVMRLLNQIPQLSYVEPGGAFYIMINVSGTGMDGETFAKNLLEEVGVAFVPANAFGDGVEDYVRMSYAASRENIEKGLGRVKAYLAEQK